MRKSIALLLIFLLIFCLLVPFFIVYAKPLHLFHHLAPSNSPDQSNFFLFNPETPNQISASHNSSLLNQMIPSGEGSFWASAYGWSRGEFSLSSIISSGNILLTGYTNSLSSQTDDAIILKINPDGSTLWGKAYSGISSDQAYFSAQSSDGGVLTVGGTNSFGAGNFDLLVFKTDAQGNLGPDFPETWARTLGGSAYDQALAVCSLGDQGFLVSGFTYSYGAGGCDLLTLKLSSSGSLDWVKTFGGSSNDYGFSNCQSLDGSLYIVGSTASFGSPGFEILVIKMNPDGSLSWAKRLGANSNEEARAVIPLQEGGIIVGGSSSSFGLGGKDLLILKLSPNGDLEWAKVFGGSLDEEIFSLSPSPEGVLVSGYTSSSGEGNKDFFILSLDCLGNLLWGKTFGGTGEDIARTISFDSQMGIIVSGYSSSFGSGSSDLLTLKLDPSGNIPGASCGHFKTWAPSTTIPNILSSFVTPTAKTPPWILSSCSLSLSSPEISSVVICQSPPSYPLNIEVSPPGSGIVSKDPDLSTYFKGTQVTLTASPFKHFHFESWTGDATGTSTIISLVMDSSKDITANFSPDLCTVTFDRNGGDTDPVPPFLEVPYGSCLDFLPQPPTKAGHTFLGWNSSPDGSGDWLDINSPIFGDLTLFAQWEVERYRLSISVEGKGEVHAPDGDFFEYGREVSLTATPFPGYQFDQWKGDVPDGHQWDNPLILKMDSEKNITAVFREIDDPVPFPSLGWMGLILLFSSLVLVSFFFL